jgi:hypothetical protein
MWPSLLKERGGRAVTSNIVVGDCAPPQYARVDVQPPNRLLSSIEDSYTTIFI